MSSADYTITPRQCRAARALIDITREELASLSGASGTILAEFESGKKIPNERSLVKICNTLEACGVDFIALDDKGEDGVRMTKMCLDGYTPSLPVQIIFF